MSFLKEGIKVGDKVVVTDESHGYSYYDTMFEELGFSNTEYNESHSRGSVGTVFAIGICDKYKEPRYAVRASDGKECLYNINGIKLISSADPLDNVGKEVYIIVNNSITKERISKVVLSKEESGDGDLMPLEESYYFVTLNLWKDVSEIYFDKEDLIKGL